MFLTNRRFFMFFFFSSRRRHTRCSRDWSSDVCSSDLSTAARTRFFRARSLILSPSKKSIARHTLPSRPALKSLSGSGRLAPWEKVSFTLSLWALATAIIPSRDHTGLPIHFHSSIISRSASRMVLRMLASVLPRQPVSSAISSSMRSDGFIGSSPCLPGQLGELNEVAAGVVQHRNGRAGHVRGRHRELGAAGLDPLVVALDVVGEEHGRGLALLKHRLLIRFGCGVVVQRQLQLSAVRLVGRGHGQPTIWALTEIGLLGKAQYLRIEAQGLILVVDVYAGHFDFHLVSPLSRSRFGPRRLLLSLPFRWSAFRWPGLIHAVLIHSIEVAFESIQVSGPKPAEPSQPGIQLLKWFRFQPVESALCVHGGFYKTGLA